MECLHFPILGDVREVQIGDELVLGQRPNVFHFVGDVNIRLFASKDNIIGITSVGEYISHMWIPYRLRLPKLILQVSLERE